MAGKKSLTCNLKSGSLTTLCSNLSNKCIKLTEVTQKEKEKSAVKCSTGISNFRQDKHET